MVIIRKTNAKVRAVCGKTYLTEYKTSNKKPKNKISKYV